MSSKHRVSQLAFHPTAPFLAVQSHDKAIDVFRIRTEDEMRKKQARRQKRVKEKKAQKAGASQEAIQEEDDPTDKEIPLVDLYTPYLIVRASGKIRSFDFVENDTHPKGIQVSQSSSRNLEG